MSNVNVDVLMTAIEEQAKTISELHEGKRELIEKLCTWIEGLKGKVESDHRDGRLTTLFKYNTLMYQLNKKLEELEKKLKDGI